MATFDEILAVNAKLKTTNIKNKPYVEVNERVLGFRELYPSGRIVTTKLEDDGMRCDFRAEIYLNQTDEFPTTTGHAYEVKSGMVNSTSYVENCETSAVGRALGLLGIGATNAIASADEVKGAIAQSEAPKRDYSSLTALKKRFAAVAGVSEGAAGKAIVTKYGDVQAMDDERYKAFLAELLAEVETMEEGANAND